MKTTKSRWKIALKTIYELAPYRDTKTAGITPEDVLGHMRIDFPDITRRGIISAISEAVNRCGAPIETRPDPEKHRGVLYYVPLGARKKTQDILASVSAPHRPAPGRIKQWEKVTAILLERAGRPSLIEPILEKFKKEFPESDTRTVHAAMNTASNKHLVPICKRMVKNRGWYFIQSVDYDVASTILLKNKQYIPPKKTTGHPPGANNSPAKSTDLVKGADGKFSAPGLEQSFREQVAGRFPKRKTPGPRAIRSENCLYLIQARAPRSLSCEDVADFFFISLEEAAEVLSATAAKYGPLVEITMHARIKK